MADLTHIARDGSAHMVDISEKSATVRIATAQGQITMSRDALDCVKKGDAKKGDVLGTARLAGIMAAKKTSDLIPLCHPLALSKVSLDFSIDEGASAINVTGLVKTTGKTGVEMEALTAVSVACLTIYDMAKAIDKSMTIGPVRLLEKSGGKSGDYKAEV